MFKSTATAIAEDVWKVECPLPGHSIGHLNSYVIKDGNTVAVVDLPWSSEEVLTSYTEALASISVNLADIELILLTHYHEDHAGAASWLQKLSSATVYMSIEDLETMNSRYRNNGAVFENALKDWLSVVGADTELSEFAVAQFRELKQYGEELPNAVALTGETDIRIGRNSIRAIPAPGHTAGHFMYLYDEQILFSGDHIFTWGTANATTRPISATLPFSSHAETSTKISKLGARKILPGHGEALDDFRMRVAEFQKQNSVRSAEILEHCSEPKSVWDIAVEGSHGRTWERFSPNSKLSILGETHAHLLELEKEGLIERLDVAPHIWFQTSITKTKEKIKEGIEN